MKRPLPLFALTAAVLTPTLAASLFAQGITSPKITAKRRTVRSSSISVDEARELRAELAAQQQQIQQLQQQVQQQAQQQVQQAQSVAAAAQSKVAALEASTAEQKASVDKLSSSFVDVKTSVTSAAVSMQDEQKRVSAVEGLLGRFRFNGDIRVRG